MVSYQKKTKSLKEKKNKMALSYLLKQLETWSFIGSLQSGLYSTYKRDTAQRADIYDNSLLVNALVMLQPGSSPPVAAVMVLNFALGAVDYLRKNPDQKLIAAAYYMNPATNQPDVCSDGGSCAVQDVGNNSVLCIAIAKFLRAFPNYEKNVAYKAMLSFLFQNMADMLQPCGNLVGYAGRISQRYISTEHQIDLCALCQVGAGLLDEPKRQEMLTNTRNFVTSMFYERPDFAAYRIGTTPDCELNLSSPQPVDTTTWNVLAGADLDQKRLAQAMNTVCRDFVVPGGVKFTLASDCAQYENTGSFLCALTVFNSKNPSLAISPQTSREAEMYAFIESRMSQGLPIPGAWPEPCPTGLGWSYESQGHLAATVYCALASTRDAQMNIYGQSSASASSVSWPFILIIAASIVLFILLIVAIVVFSRR